ncbi:MAG TPA: sulfatase [Sphingobacteriaceae bacterium]|nr:sulfatase [Sphingobacteriaceae bacterium]
MKAHLIRIKKFGILTIVICLGMLHIESTKAVAQKRPNILFCIADDASYKYLSTYGTSWVRTPTIDRIAKEGLLFMNAYTPNAKCSPSRASILTGRNSWQLEEAGNHSPVFPIKFTTYVESLYKNGYKVGYTGKGWAPGIAKDANGGNRLLTGSPFNELKRDAPTKGISGIDYAANFQAFLNKKSKDEPFCFWYGGIEPHREYEYGTGVSIGKKKISDITEVPPFWPDNEKVRNDMLDYAYEVEYFDHQLSKILEVLEKSGELENTLIVVTSDNGMPFPRVKGHVFEHDNHMPLIVMWKNGIKVPGRRITDFVSFIDFAPTFLEVAGVKSNLTGMQPITGESLVKIFKSDKNGTVENTRDHVLLGKERTDLGRPKDAGYPVRGIVKGNFIYSVNYEPGRWPAGNPETGYLDTDGSPTKTIILEEKRNGINARHWDMAFGLKGSEELYQLNEDPYSMSNLAENKSYQKIKNELKAQMEKELKEQQDPRMFGKGNLFDEYPYGNESSRGFYERYMKGEKINTGWVNKSDYEKVEK